MGTIPSPDELAQWSDSQYTCWLIRRAADHRISVGGTGVHFKGKNGDEVRVKREFFEPGYPKLAFVSLQISASAVELRKQIVAELEASGYQVSVELPEYAEPVNPTCYVSCDIKMLEERGRQEPDYDTELVNGRVMVEWAMHRPGFHHLQYRGGVRLEVRELKKVHVHDTYDPSTQVLVAGGEQYYRDLAQVLSESGYVIEPRGTWITRYQTDEGTEVKHHGFDIWPPGEYDVRPELP